MQHQLARAAVDVEAARLAVYNAARLRDAGLPFLTEAAICKILSSEVAERVASLAVNLFGGNGFVKEYPVEKLYRDAKIGQIYEGTSNLQLQTIAKQTAGGLTGSGSGISDRGFGARLVARFALDAPTNLEPREAPSESRVPRVPGPDESRASTPRICSAMTIRCTSDVPW